MTDLRKAAEMALEALEWSWGGEPLGTKEFEAITALRQALAQPDDIYAAVLAEREACAKVCEGIDIRHRTCAHAIRQRGKK